MFPDKSILPEPVILFEFKSKLPPSCGVVSSTTFASPPPPPPPSTPITQSAPSYFKILFVVTPVVSTLVSWLSVMPVKLLPSP